MYQYAIINSTGHPIMGNIPLPPVITYQSENPLDANDYFYDAERANSHMFVLSIQGRVFAIGQNGYGQCVRVFLISNVKGVQTSNLRTFTEIKIPNEKIRKVATGINYSLFITDSGHVY